MKRFVSLIVLLSMLFGMGGIFRAEEDNTVNVFDNGGMEAAQRLKAEDGAEYLWPAGFTASGDAVSGVNTYATDEKVRSGKYSLKMEGNCAENTNRVAYLISDLIPGQAYEVSGYVLIEGSVSKNGVYIYARKGASYGTLYPQQSSNLFETGGKWVRIATKFVAPAASVYIWILKHGDGGKVYLDDFQAYPVINMAVNDGFEYEELVAGKIPSWMQSSGAVISERDAFEGGKCVQLSGTSSYAASQYSISADAPYFEAGKEYTLSYMMKTSKDSSLKAAVEYTDEDKSLISADEKNFKSISGNYEEYTMSFTPPRGAVNAKLMLYGANGKSYIDNVCITNEDSEKNYAAALEKIIPENTIKEPAQGQKELIQNGGFEELLSDGNPAGGFDGYSSYKGGYATLSKENPHSGNNCIRLWADETGKNPWVRYIIKDAMPGAEYQISAWLLRSIVTDDRGPYIKVEYYEKPDALEGTAGSLVSQSFIKLSKTGVWSRVGTTFVVPNNARCAAIYFRLNGIGEVYYDDVQCYISGMPAAIDGSSNQVFYYSDVKTGIYTASLSSAYEIRQDSYIDFQLEDSTGKILDKMDNIPISGNMKYEFPVTAMTERLKPYYIKAEYKSGDGTLLGTAEQEIYKVERPAQFSKDGKCTMDGKRFTPCFGYHVFDFSAENLAKIKRIGVNVLQYGVSGKNAETIKNDLDNFYKNGMYAMVCLYVNMIPAGAEVNRENSEAILKAIAGHPAIFSYAIMDEPFLHDSFEIVYENLKKSYLMIKTYDSGKAITMVESSSARAFYKYDLLFCDALVPDPYARYEKRMPTYIGENIKMAKDDANGEKPVYNLMQAYFLEEYTPTPNSMYHMMYQGFFEGGEGMGYYPIECTSAEKLKGSVPIWDYELAKAAFGIGEGGELAEAASLFVFGDYPVFNMAVTEEAAYISYVKNNELYLILLNRRWDKSVKVDIPLVSYNGKASVGSFTAEAVKNIYDGAPVSGDGVFSVELDRAVCAKYKITPSEAADFSQLEVMTYRDLIRHGWAKEAIDSLTGKGIASGVNNGFYRPAENITRGDFAMLLMKTLGLTAEGGQQFADVSESAEYGGYIKAGRALGILNGVGDNRFDPLEEISRQDMMTITARAMSLSKDCDLSVYSDSDKIADYALPHVKAMIAEGFIKGNADGTVNPQGNATRAETAVIMHRIYNR